jgi:hypothetical protein
MWDQERLKVFILAQDTIDHDHLGIKYWLSGYEK